MDLSNIKTWVFDLDNTIYSPQKDIFGQIDKRMTKFITAKLKVNEDDAFKIQKKYFIKYGTTLAGLMKEDKVQPKDFLDFVHDIDLSCLSADTELSSAIKQLKGKKIIFTNGSKTHAEKVISRLELNNVFDEIFDIEDSQFIPKPQIQAYLNFFKKFKLDPKKTIMFEDMSRNLVPAKKLGMTTVLIKREMPMKEKKYHFKEFEDLWKNNNEADYIVDDLVKFFNKYYKDSKK